MIEALVAALCISLLSLVGVFFFGKNERLSGIHSFILPLAVGVFLGIVFFELIPETLEDAPLFGPVFVLVGFLGFYLLSHILETFHHHHAEEHDCVHDSARMLLIGDAIHNFADGVVIASAFMIDPVVGMLTTLGIALHEIPQEIGEFGVLLHAGYAQKRALFYNFLSATTVFIGVLVTYFFSRTLGEFLFILTGIAAGNLLYIATADLIPELRESHRTHFIKSFAITAFGVLAIAALLSFTHAHFG